jgi:hypothetical protein
MPPPQVSQWREQLLVFGGILALTGLDIVASALAKEWTLRRHLLVFLSGLALYLAVYLVYAFSLRIATLTVVTLGWTVLLQVSVVLLDRYRYGAELGLDHWAIVLLLIAGLVYLVLNPPGSPSLNG